MIKGYIFDMDGTLVDSMPMLCRLDVEIFAAIGLVPTQKALDDMRYIPTGKTAEYIRANFDTTLSEAEIMDILTETAIVGYQSVKMKSGALKYLRFCKSQGIRMCIATATETHIARKVAAQMGFDVYFDDIISCTDAGATKAKPDVFLEAARRMGLSPSECAVFEDGLPGAASAANAGFTVVGVYDTMAGDVESSSLESISHRYIRSFTDIENTLV